MAFHPAFQEEKPPQTYWKYRADKKSWGRESGKKVRPNNL
jgi:hypothetical protein